MSKENAQADSEMSLDDRIRIRIDGSERELFMSFNLLRELSVITNSTGDLAAVLQSPVMFDSFLETLLWPRDEKLGRRAVKKEGEEDFFLENAQIAPEDALRAVSWALEHVIRFFLMRFSAIQKLGDRNKAEIERLASFLTGSGLLASTSASHGLSPSAQAPSASSMSDAASTT